MNTDKKSIYTTKQSKNITLVLIGFTGVFLFISSLYIITALLSTVILYILFKPLYLYLAEKKKY